jgi:hypothetical protein
MLLKGALYRREIVRVYVCLKFVAREDAVETALEKSVICRIAANGYQRRAPTNTTSTLLVSRPSIIIRLDEGTLFAPD